MAAIASSPNQDFVLIRGQSGFWRIAKARDGVWWFLSPQNQKYFMNSVTSVQPFQLGRLPGTEFVSEDWNGPLDFGLALQDHEALKLWAKATWNRISSLGLRGLGAWSNPIFHELQIPISRDLNLSGDEKLVCDLIFSPNWKKNLEEILRLKLEPLKNNANLVGYFTDNEIDWYSSDWSPSTYFDGLSPRDPNRREVVKIIRELWPKISEFNSDWKTEFKSWEDFERGPYTWTRLPSQPKQAYEKLWSAWLKHSAEFYFKTTSEALHRFDPNHLNLGVRYRGYAPKEVIEASKKYLDAQSLNYYVSDAKLDRDFFEGLYQTSGSPILISEYSFHSDADNRSHDSDHFQFDAGRVWDQLARAEGYRQMTTALARVPYVVGADFFQWNDEPSSGRISDGEDVNFGIVDTEDRLYEGLAKAIREVSPQLDDWHQESAERMADDIWRTRPEKMERELPYLRDPIAFNGGTTLWPKESELVGIHSDLLGVQRSGEQKPRLWWGWRPEGIYFRAEVSDADKKAAGEWPNDRVDIWISSVPVRSDWQSFNAFSHHFAFRPIRIGQRFGNWTSTTERPEALRELRTFSSTVGNGSGYRVEVLIPASELRVDLRQLKEFSFNINFHRGRNALDYFWSSSRQWGGDRIPARWGRVRLRACPRLASSGGPKNLQ